MTQVWKDLRPGILWAGGLIALALAASLARRYGYLDQESVLRLVIGANGLMIAWFGNRMPKAVAPSACARQVTRFAGWSLVLSGLVYAALWVLAPIDTAITFGTIVLLAGMAATLGYCLRLRARAGASNAPR